MQMYIYMELRVGKMRAKFGGHATRQTSFLGLFFFNFCPPVEKPCEQGWRREGSERRNFERAPTFPLLSRRSSKLETTRRQGRLSRCDTLYNQ